MDVKELAEKLAKYPDLKQRIEEMLAIAQRFPPTKLKQSIAPF